MKILNMKYALLIAAFLLVGCEPVENIELSSGVEMTDELDLTEFDSLDLLERVEPSSAKELEIRVGKPEKETLNGYDVVSTFEGERMNADGTRTERYTIEIPVRHGKPIKTTWSGKVVEIPNGDTVKVLNDANEQINIRLESIDTPDSNQPYGELAKEKLRELIHEKVVTVLETGKDSNGRTLAFIELPIADGVLDISREMVRMGYAWHFTEHSKSESLGFDEQKARRENCGLWAGEGADTPVAPWEWRKQNK